ncbi:NeuD/PglB/VioB family sugar acetyltransferase [Brachybacterium alimentarium]|uniref:NeuD/PglB/VioB family sugar acetyltransferase n=1 Tax=Brachybacterium alimentarium TaxID=47845 RepID=UPI003FD4B606
MSASYSAPHDLVIVSAAGTGRETVDVLRAVNKRKDRPWNLLGVLDDGATQLQRDRLEAQGTAFLGAVDAWLDARTAPSSYVVAIAHTGVRRLLAAKFDAAGHSPATLVHPDVPVGSSASIGAGAIVYPGAQISTNVQLGRHAILNAAVYVAHDVTVGDFVSVNPRGQLSGEVTIEDDVLIGAAAIVLQGLRVGRGTTIGASALVTKNVPPNVVVKGIPGGW